MDISIKELRTQPGRVLSMVNAGTDITITMRGKPTAKIIPIAEAPGENPDEMFIGFGIFKDCDEMADSTAYVSAMRKGRSI